MAAWAIKTSGGIILIDATYDYAVKDMVEAGFRSEGLDPAQIKALFDAQAKTITQANAGTLMGDCAKAVQTKVDLLQSLAPPQPPQRGDGCPAGQRCRQARGPERHGDPP